VKESGEGESESLSEKEGMILPPEEGTMETVEEPIPAEGETEASEEKPKKKRGRKKTVK
ncbi:hypothetical protein HY628_00980, partial [Candidatus Uhrbacteria bacterium]|nr:hypothetical protein [Candidatus Uhrbacteria bacterium]